MDSDIGPSFFKAQIGIYVWKPIFVIAAGLLLSKGKFQNGQYTGITLFGIAC